MVVWVVVKAVVTVGGVVQGSQAGHVEQVGQVEHSSQVGQGGQASHLTRGHGPTFSTGQSRKIRAAITSTVGLILSTPAQGEEVTQLVNCLQHGRHPA